MTWQTGSDGTQTYLGRDEVMRCWNLQNRFDCLYANVFDIREQIADAPVRRSYNRFLTSRLPVRKSDLDGLDTSDGYECSTSVSRDRSSVLETIWKDGRIVEQSPKNQEDPLDNSWTAEEVLTMFGKHTIQPRRPYFACALVDEIVTKMGLEALDSPLVTYGAIMQIDRPADNAEKGVKPEEAGTGAVD